MGFHITDMQLNVLFQTWQTNYHIYATRNFSGGGRFSDTDCIRYGKIEYADEIVFDKKSDYSFKEVLSTRFSNPFSSLRKGKPKKPIFPKKAQSFSCVAATYLILNDSTNVPTRRSSGYLLSASADNPKDMPDRHFDQLPLKDCLLRQYQNQMETALQYDMSSRPAGLTSTLSVD